MAQDEFDLGRLLGQREAFNSMAGRCSAADVALMRQIRQEKSYLLKAADWEQFCDQHLHISKDTANRLIRYLDQFGPGYFEVAQLTRVSPETYRLIAPSIHEQTLHHDGVAIALIPENAQRVAAAIADVRRQAAQKALPAAEAPAVEDPVLRLERRCSDLVREIEAIVETRKQPRQVQAAVIYLRQRLERIERTI